MLTGESRASDPSYGIDTELLRAVEDWSPPAGNPPAVAVEPRPDGLRVKLTYLGVETGVLFPRGVPAAPPRVHETLDRLYEVLSWRVIRPPAC